jgi:bacterioferritin-associated ferredoxin
MIVCVCRRVSDRDIEGEVRAGCTSFDELQETLLVGTACGACTDCARKTFDSHCSARHGAGRSSMAAARTERLSVAGALA